MSLTVCLLTRNEEQTVARAIASVRDVAGEILVADTASSDRTAEVAKDAGAAVTQFRWEDDFSAGRNDLVARASGDWILWLDPKEELSRESVEPLRDAMSRDDAFGYFVQVRHVDESGTRVVAEAADVRLFRRRDDVKFIGRLHPHFDPGVVDAVKREGLSVGPSDVVLRHYAQPGRSNEAKLRWTARLLELELRDRPGQLHYLIEHGRTLLLLNDPRGHDVLAAAADIVLAAREAPRPPSAKVQVLLQHVLSTDAAGGKFPLDHETARELALRWFPASPPLLWMLAEQRFSTGEYARAANLLERLVRLGKTGTYDRSQAFAPGLVGERALLNVAACYLKLDRPGEAEACLLQITPTSSLAPVVAKQLATARRMKG